VKWGSGWKKQASEVRKWLEEDRTRWSEVKYIYVPKEFVNGE